MTELPKQLQNPEFRFLPLGKITLDKEGKKKIQDIEPKWQTINNYSFDKLPSCENVGIVSGFGNLVIVDIDNSKLHNELCIPLTFSIQTAIKGLPHYYFFIDEPIENATLFYQGRRSGEIRARNEFCICLGEIEGKHYEVLDDLPISKISKDDFYNIFGEYIKKSDEKTTTETKEKDESRSGLEYRRVVALMREGKSKEEIYQKMTAYSKWAEQGEAYRDFTFKKARTFVDTEQENGDKLNIIYDKDLRNFEIKKIDWLVEDVIPENAVCFVGGKRGCFKSFASLVMAYSCASGKKLFDKFETKKIKVLFLDEENGYPLLKERGIQIKNGLGIQEDEDIDIAFLSFANLKLDKQEWINKLKAFLDEFKPNLIIVDSLRRFVGFEENDAGEVSKLFTDVIRPLSQEYKLSWILLHHLRKGMSGKYVSDEMDEMRGSSDLSNYADIVLILNRTRGSNDSFVLKQAKCRYKQEMTSKIIQMDWGENNLKMTCIGDAEDTLIQVDICAKEIVKWMAENQKDSFKAKEVKDALEKESPATINRALKLLKDDGQLISVRRGYYQKGSVDLSEFLEEEPQNKDEKHKKEKTFCDGFSEKEMMVNVEKLGTENE